MFRLLWGKAGITEGIIFRNPLKEVRISDRIYSIQGNFSRKGFFFSFFPVSDCGFPPLQNSPKNLSGLDLFSSGGSIGLICAFVVYGVFVAQGRYGTHVS